MNRPAVRTMLLFAAAMTALSFPVAAHAAFPEQLLLDTWSPGDPNVVATTDQLTAGRFYVADVAGTWSHFESHRYFPHFTACGHPQADADLPAPGRPQSKVGEDAEFIFSRPAGVSGNCHSLPQAWNGFQLKLTAGSAFSHPTPRGGAPAAPSA